MSKHPAEAEDSEPVPQRAGFEHITEGYVRFTDVAFHWCKALNPWQANAVKALIHNNALVHPDHPLHIPGEEGIKLYLGTDRVGKQRLLFSLRQLEYLQYYIHEMGLTDPKRVISLVAESQEASEDKENLPPIEYEDVPEWVPLPSHVIRPSYFVKLEPSTFTTVAAIKKMVKQLHSHNRNAEKEALRNNPTPSMINREAAKKENATSGPGLRNGPLRQRDHSPRPRRRKSGPKGNDEVGEGDGEGAETGWGGFPLKQKDDGGPSEVAATTVPPQGQEEEVVDASNKEATETTVKEVASMTDEELKALTSTYKWLSPADTPEASVPQPASEEVVTSTEAPVENFTTNYYFHAQQAFIVASLGGLTGALEAGGDEVGPPQQTGRSLFLAFDITTWEADADVVLELGWAAMWYQPKLEATEEDESGFEEMRDAGHYIVQDHLLTKKNGHWRPHNRDHYRFGQSLPIAEKDISSQVKRLITDLSKKAGGGPTYILVHSPDTSHSDLGKKIGLESSTWERRLKPSGWEYASYASPDGIGKTFVLDTAILFAAIEHDPTKLPAPMYTKKTLEEVAWIMSGQEKDRAPVFCGNAGNDAFYNLEVFLASESGFGLIHTWLMISLVVSGPPIQDLRKDFQQSQQPVGKDTTEPQAFDSEPEERETAKVVQTIPLTPVGDAEEEAVVKPIIRGDDEDEEEYDSEEDAIKGVYYDDDQGNLVRIH